MIQHIKISPVIFCLLISLIVGCGNGGHSHITGTEDTTEIDPQKNDLSGETGYKGSEGWFFYKVLPVSTSSDCPVEAFSELQVYLPSDSTILVNQKEEQLYWGTVATRSFLKHAYVFDKYKQLLSEQLSITLPDTVGYIRNKNAHQQQSALKPYFQEAFFVHDFMIFEHGGCLIVFSKANNQANKTDTGSACVVVKADVALPFSSKDLSGQSPQYQTAGCSLDHEADLLCGQSRLRYFPVKTLKDIYLVLVPQDCGDFKHRFYLVTISGKDVRDKLYVSGDWYEPDNDDKLLERTTFQLDVDNSLTVYTKTTAGDKLISEANVKYTIDDKGNIRKQ